MKVYLPDQTCLEVSENSTVKDVALSISEGLLRNAVAGKVNGELCDLATAIKDGDVVQIITMKDKEGLEVYRHTCSHVLAQAVKSIYPTCKLAIGPVVENGFYYDIEFKTPIAQEDLQKIEAEMQKIIKSDLPIERFELERDKAISLCRRFKEPYKVQLIEDLPEDSVISFYKQGAFTDLCRGPHLPSTGKIKAFKLTSLTGAYWRGNSKNKMLTRIYGTAFEKKSQLEEYLQAVEQAKLRDHNKLGRELGYFTTVDAVGQGLPVLLEKGTKTIQVLQRFVEDYEQKKGYILTKTPLMAKSDFYKISGHWDHYRDGMFVIGDEKKDKEVFALRPMTCPFQFQVYLNKPRSYRDLPMRFNETSTLFRNEESGEMHGLIRVRQFTISEGHLACRPDQLEQEFKGCVDVMLYMMKALGLDGDISYRFSKWDKNNKEKYIGSEEEWESVQNTMRNILDDIGITYTEADGEAAFYGPKLDVQIKNVFGKEDTLVTIQIDFQLAKRFEMVYTDSDGEKKYPYVIHRTSLGCYERTLALLIEKYAGALPTWIAPFQTTILSVNDRCEDYCKDLWSKMLEEGLRPNLDLRAEKIGKKIRDAQLDKVPYMLIIGDKELENGNTVGVRHRKLGDLGQMTIDDFIARVKSEVKELKLD
ncbi:MAG: threonine--tRNA ligase [Clostridia bacterium]|nr:threonine--tRNA ligase [Clostridia bacterium]